MREKWSSTGRSRFEISVRRSWCQLWCVGLLCTASVATAEEQSGTKNKTRVSQSKPPAVRARPSKPQLKPQLVASIQQARRKLQTARSALKLTPAQWTKAAELEKKLDESRRAAVLRVAARLKAAAQRAARSKKPVSVGELTEANRQDLRSLGTRDVDAVVGLMLRKAAEPETVQLSAATEQAHQNIEQRKRLRESILNLREVIRDWPNPGRQSVTWTRADGTLKHEVLTKAQAVELLEQLEAQYDSLSELSDLMQFRLQSAMQKQQQAFELLSALIKSFHEAANAIISNLK